MLKMALERDGFAVVAGADAREGSLVSLEEPFDVLMSDLHMPRGGDGFTVVGAIRHTHPRAVKLVLTNVVIIAQTLSFQSRTVGRVTVQTSPCKPEWSAKAA